MTAQRPPRHDFDPATVAPDGRRPVKTAIPNWTDALPRCNVQGEAVGTGITVLFYSTETVGAGPRLHIHPYDELFIIRRGSARFTVGGEQIFASAGEAVLGPKGLPHTFHNLGPGPLETVDIHLSPRWIQTDLD